MHSDAWLGLESTTTEQTNTQQDATQNCMFAHTCIHTLKSVIFTTTTAKLVNSNHREPSPKFLENAFVLSTPRLNSSFRELPENGRMNAGCCCFPFFPAAARDVATQLFLQLAAFIWFWTAGESVDPTGVSVARNDAEWCGCCFTGRWACVRQKTCMR